MFLTVSKNKLALARLHLCRAPVKTKWLYTFSYPERWVNVQQLNIGCSEAKLMVWLHYITFFAKIRNQESHRFHLICFGRKWLPFISCWTKQCVDLFGRTHSQRCTLAGRQGGVGEVKTLRLWSFLSCFLLLRASVFNFPNLSSNCRRFITMQHL